MKTLLTFLTLAASSSSYAVTSPIYAYMKIYSAAVSTSETCENPVVLFDSTEPQEVNMYDSPTLGGGTIPDGTYKCLMMKMSDTIRFKTNAADGSGCAANTEYYLDVCRTGVSGDNPITGATISCTGSTQNAQGTDTVYVYLSTGSTATTGSSSNNAFQRPTSVPTSSKGMNLSGSFIVAGATSGQFIMDVTNKVDGSTSGTCDLLPPTFKFR